MVMIMNVRHWVNVLVIVVLSAVTAQADDAPPTSAAAKLSAAEQTFVDSMSKSVLVGSFTIDGKEDTTPRPERYGINGVTKVEGANWIVSANIKYGDNDITIPVPVEVHWAGDTPMIQVTNLSLPGLGDGFSSRVLFYDGRYAGTWAHGKVGGVMFGKIEKASDSK